MLNLFRFLQVKRADIGNPALVGPAPRQAIPMPGQGVPPVTESSITMSNEASRSAGTSRPNVSAAALPAKVKKPRMPAPGADSAFQPTAPKPSAPKIPSMKSASGILRLAPTKEALSFLPGPDHMSAGEKLRGIGRGALDELGTQIEAMETRPIPMLIPQQQREQSPTVVNVHPAHA